MCPWKFSDLMRQLGGGPGKNLTYVQAFADRVNGGELRDLVGMKL
jgi:hypothetical protein